MKLKWNQLEKLSTPWIQNNIKNKEEKVEREDEIRSM